MNSLFSTVLHRYLFWEFKVQHPPGPVIIWPVTWPVPMINHTQAQFMTIYDWLIFISHYCINFDLHSPRFKLSSPFLNHKSSCGKVSLTALDARMERTFRTIIAKLGNVSAQCVSPRLRAEQCHRWSPHSTSDKWSAVGTRRGRLAAGSQVSFRRLKHICDVVMVI